MTSARGISGSASGLIGRHDDRGQRRAEQRTGQEQRVKLRVGAGRRKHDLGICQSEMVLEFVAHGLDACIERRVDADGNRRPHQCFPRMAGALKGPQRNRRRGAGGETQRVRAGRRLAAIFIGPGGRVEAQSRIAAAAEQPIQRREQFRHRGG